MNTQTAIRRASLQHCSELEYFGTAISPELEVISQRMQRLTLGYQRTGPGSETAFRYIIRLSSECRRLIHKLIIAKPASEYYVEFFSGTSRALEVALTRRAGNWPIILSPFEHPTLTAVTGWISSIMGRAVHQLRCSPDDFSSSCATQQSLVVDAVNAILTADARPSILVLSQVCYATGIRIPADEIMRALRERHDENRLLVIIDGAHAAGNGSPMQFAAHADAYVLSGHKWLLAPQPCGVVITRGEQRNPAIVYDAWGDDIPTSTANATMVAGLLSALSVIHEVGFDSLWSHAREMQCLFLEQMDEVLHVIGSEHARERSQLIAVRPRSGYRWKLTIDEMRHYLRKNGVHVTMLSIDPTVPWMRIAFPCFIEEHQVHHLCSTLMKCIASDAL